MEHMTDSAVSVSRALNSVALLTRTRAIASRHSMFTYLPWLPEGSVQHMKNMLNLCLVKGPLQTQSAEVELELLFEEKL